MIKNPNALKSRLSALSKEVYAKHYVGDSIGSSGWTTDMIRRCIETREQLKRDKRPPEPIFDDFANTNERTRKIGARLAEIVQSNEHWREEHAFQPKGVQDLIRLYFEQEVPCVVPNERAEMGKQIDEILKRNKLKLTDKDLEVAHERLYAVARLVLELGEHRPKQEFHNVYYAANALADKFEEMLAQRRSRAR